MQPARMRFVLPIGITMGLVSCVVHAATLTVAPVGTDPPPDFNSIQEAIDFALDGDCIDVEPGTYVENIDFLGKAIVVQSTSGSDLTIIDGSGCTAGVDSCSVATFATGEGPDSVLQGFTLTGGLGSGLVFGGGGVFCDTSSPTIADCSIIGNAANLSGGGVSAFSSGVTLTNCNISGNTAASIGGGVRTEFDSSLTLVSCTINGNTANVGGGMVNAGSSATLTSCTIVGNVGSGIVSGSSSLTLTGCTISDNAGDGLINSFSFLTLTECTIDGNAGRGMANTGGSVTLADCTVSGNTATNGAGMRNLTLSVNLTNCTISENTAVEEGGGMSNVGGTIEMTNCTIIGNSAGESGAGMYNYSSSPVLTSCTFSGNLAGVSGGGIQNSSSASPVVTNCILWGDTPNEIQSDGPFDVTFSDVQGAFPGTGNIDDDPIFVDPENGDFHLQVGSPCIDAGDPTSPPDPDGTIVDMGAFFFPQLNFLRGDADADGIFSGLTDGLFLLNFQFLGGAAPPCLDAADADDSGAVSGLVDSLYVLNFQFVPGSLPPPPPYPDCWSDPTRDGLGCASSSSCP